MIKIASENRLAWANNKSADERSRDKNVRTAFIYAKHIGGLVITPRLDGDNHVMTDPHSR